MILSSNPKKHGLTIIEVLVIMFALVLLAMLIVPALISAKQKAAKIQCANNLMQTSFAFHIWEGEHNDKYPMNASVTNGPEFIPPTAVNAEAVFQVMSNELSTPFVLICPADKRCQMAVSFNSLLTSSNISYFVNLDATEANPQNFLCGDDNFEIGGIPVKSGILEIRSNTPIAWSSERHGRSANVAIADGSVQGMNNLTLPNWLHSTNSTSFRLTIP